MTERFLDTTIVLPAINETYSFEQTVEQLLERVERRDLAEILAVVCDRTTAESRAAIARAGAMAERAGVPFAVLEQRRPFVGGAYQDAFDAARGSHLVIMSSDLETDPATVPDLIAQSKAHPSEVIGASRWLRKGSFSGYDPKKQFLNRIFQRVFALYYGAQLTDMTYGFRIYPTELARSIAWEELKHPFFLETAIKPVRLGLASREVPTSWTARTEGESQNSFLETFKYVPPALRMRFEPKDRILKEGAPW